MPVVWPFCFIFLNTWRPKLERLECLRSEDTPRRLMITHSIESYWIPSQKKTKSKLQILRICQKFLILKQTLHGTHLLKLLDKMCKYEMDPTNIVEDIELTGFCPQTDRWTSVLHIWYKYQVKLDALHSAPTYLCGHLLAVIFLDQTDKMKPVEVEGIMKWQNFAYVFQCIF